MKCDILKVSFLYGRRCIIDPTSPYFSIIRNHFSYDNPAARFTKYARIPKRIYSITTKGYCDIGFLWIIKDFIEKEKWNLKLKISDKVKGILVNTINCEIEEVPNTKYKLRDYQFDSVTNGLKLGGGLCLVGTGGGKSLIIATLLETIFKKHDTNMKTLLVVPNLALIKQMYDDFTEYQCSFTFSKWSGSNELNPNTNVVIVNTGYLQSSEDRSDEYNDFFKQINYLFYDEAHLFGNQPEPKASILLKKYEYRNVFGFTGSLPDNTYSSNKVYGFFGKPFYVKTSKSLIDEKYLSNIEVKMININHNVDFESIYDFDGKTEIENYNLEIDYITGSTYRNDCVKKIVDNLNGNVLILVDRIEQGERLLNVFKSIKNKRCFFIRGSMDVDDRSKISDEMEISNDIICIAMSKIFSVGISINNISYGLFYYIGKAWNKTIQSIGRGLRLHENKDKFVLFDICDNLIFSQKHSQQRKNIYKNQKINFKDYYINEK